MQKIEDITSVHIELTDKCQAQCPMCARNYHGGAVRPFIRNGDISIEQFKEWFPKEFLEKLYNFYSCGNYGDPAFAKDCLEIYEYVRSCNKETRLALHTNGGMRDPKWWSKLAIAIGTQRNSEVIFAVDGFPGKHELYRRNTKFEKVIENMSAFINAGGTARVDSLVFAHNEHETEELESYLLDLGVDKVNFISTTRFYEMKEYKVQNVKGDIEYYLKPAELPKWKKTPNKSLENLLDVQFRESAIEKSVIDPKCTNEQSIYVDPYGSIFPCCWIGGDSLEQPIEETLPIHKLRNLSVQNTKEMLEVIGIPKCQHGALKQTGALWPKLNTYWNGKDKCMTCARQCSKLIYDSNNKYE
jgi:MoaA/NifB/PqqE/SkfB family radical SAM enzyme|tara:strand:+ start:50524 stop:51594 length:1071 start_codon:yes stop_codon:yes gene_type:complete